MAPSPPHQRESWLKPALFCAVLGALLTGCSALTLTYTYAQRLLLWKVDRYFQLSDEQDKLVKARLADLHTWHRQTELPRYAEFLRQVQDRWRDGVSAEEIEWAFDTFAKLRAELAGRVASAGAVFLPTVDAKQIKHLDRPNPWTNNGIEEHRLRSGQERRPTGADFALLGIWSKQ